MKVITQHLSPNFDSTEIPVEYLILHYTACDIARALEIFKDPTKKVCAHFIIDVNGDVYDLGGFFNGPIKQGAHAGVSRFNNGTRILEKFNTFSLGIEIVNLNGNLFPYTQAQYQSLAQLTTHLCKRFPALQNPERVLGHEDIAGFRGKVDPGILFEWGRFFQSAYGEMGPERVSILNSNEVADLKAEAAKGSESDKKDPMFWSRLSAALEERIKKRMSS